MPVRNIHVHVWLFRVICLILEDFYNHFISKQF